MSGLSDYSAENVLNWETGNAPMPALASRFLALFVAPPTADAVTGGVEMAGGNYARVQVAGEITAAGAISTSSATITMPNVSGYPWVVAGMNVYDITAGKQIGTVLTYTGTTLTLTGNAANAGSGSTDSLAFSAWPAASASSGNEPATAPANVTNSGAVVNFPQAAGTEPWGGALAAGASFTTASTTITMGAAVPSWVVAGANVYDVTASAQIGTVASVAGSTVTLSAAAAHASSGSTDSLLFSAPAVAWGLFDALSGGNPITWDYLGNNKWIPFSCSSASPGVLTCDSTSDAPANGSSIVVTQKYGGTLPTTGGSWSGLLTTANLSGATFTAGVNTTGIGGGQFRQLTQQPISINVTASFATSTFTLTAA